MRIRDPFGISLVSLSVVLFAILWLPRLDVDRFGRMWTTPIPSVALALFVLCSLSLLVLIIRRGRRGLWLLIGLIPAAYWPSLLTGFLVACPFLAPNPACDF